jgi:hypothetical protein
MIEVIFMYIRFSTATNGPKITIFGSDSMLEQMSGAIGKGIDVKRYSDHLVIARGLDLDRQDVVKINSLGLTNFEAELVTELTFPCKTCQTPTPNEQRWAGGVHVFGPFCDSHGGTGRSVSEALARGCS